MTPTIDAVDTDGMHDAVETLPEQLRSAWESARERAGVVRARWARESRPRSVIVCGMGGSGIGADLAGALVATDWPIVPVKGYDLPEWVGSDDAVICVSYSGNTEETLSCWHQAREVASPVAVITCGGELAEQARAHDVPVVSLEPGMQPRAAVGVLFASLSAVLESLPGCVDAGRCVTAAIRGATRMIRRHEGWGEDVPARQLAARMAGTIPIIYGAGAGVVAAARWKAQINENAKLPCWSGPYPELDHNEIVGWQGARETGGRFSVIELALASQDARMDLRRRITAELIADDVDMVEHVTADEQADAAGLFELIVLGDYLSVALAVHRGIDPTPVARISKLKGRLADGR